MIPGILAFIGVFLVIYAIIVWFNEPDRRKWGFPKWVITGIMGTIMYILGGGHVGLLRLFLWLMFRGETPRI